MTHTSVRLDMPIEFINVTPLNPLYSRCQIKVCWVGEDPNRNGSIITKDVAREMANSLPGSPIVGYYNENIQDFEGHNRDLIVEKGKLVVKDITRPYGFVDLNAKVWFQRFLDDGLYEREYLMTEGYLWTGQYPEAQRIIDKGNNQSMELEEKFTSGSWTKDEKGNAQFFIINETIISKLCILGEDTEPCFEGASVTRPIVQFTLDNNFKETLFTMMNELKDLLNKGGEKVFNKYAVEIGGPIWKAVYTSGMNIIGFYEDEEQPFAVYSADDKYYRINFSSTEESITVVSPVEFELEEGQVLEPQFSAEDIAKYEEDNKDEDDDEEVCDKCGKPVSECSCPEYNLEEIEEYVALNSQYSELETKYNTLVADYEALKSSNEALVTFKADVEKKEKQAMINSFDMLTEEDKRDVVENIDNYSLEEIEGKLSIICVRNKVTFNSEETNPTTTYNLGGNDDALTGAPAWVKAALSISKNM